MKKFIGSLIACATLVFAFAAPAVAGTSFSFSTDAGSVPLVPATAAPSCSGANSAFVGSTPVLNGGGVVVVGGRRFARGVGRRPDRDRGAAFARGARAGRRR